MSNADYNRRVAFANAELAKDTATRKEKKPTAKPDDDLRKEVERLAEEVKALRKRVDDEANKLETEW